MNLIGHRQHKQLEAIRRVDDKPESKKDPSPKKVYVKPELKRIPLDDEEALLEYSKAKPYSAQELKEVIKGMLHPNERKRNGMVLERIKFHINEATRFCNQLDLSRLGPLEQREWDTRMKDCKDAIAFCRESLKKLSEILK
jgi:hypothetical protein